MPEDRCHLNGLALVDGKPKYVTALGETDSVAGWRDDKATGGLLIDVESGEIVLRGLTFFGNIALVGLCKICETNIFGGMPVQESNKELLCGVAVVNLKTGRAEGLFEFTSGCTEIYDVRFLPGNRKPNILNLEKPELRDAMAAPDFAYWLRPDKVIEDKT